MFWTVVLSQLKNAISWIADPKNRTIILFILIACAGIFMFHQSSKINALEAEKQTYNSNVVALTDSLETYQTGNGDLVAQKGALQSSVKDLKTLNRELYNELQIEKNKPPKTITKIETVIQWDTVYADSNEYIYLGDNSYEITWAYEESGTWGLRALEGKSRFDFVGDSTLMNINTQIVKDIFKISITTGFRETPEGYLQAYARTSAPNVNFTQVDGAIIDPKNFVDQPVKRWGIGFHVGYGVNTKLEASPYIGIGLSYDPIRF